MSKTTSDTQTKWPNWRPELDNRRADRHVLNYNLYRVRGGWMVEHCSGLDLRLNPWIKAFPGLVHPHARKRPVFKKTLALATDYVYRRRAALLGRGQRV